MLHQNYGKSYRQLYDIATRVLNHDDSVTSKDCEIALNSGFVTWELDIDGMYPSPTDEYIFWLDRFDPVPPENLG